MPRICLTTGGPGCRNHATRTGGIYDVTASGTVTFGGVMQNDIKFTGRTLLVLVAFAAWLACIIGVMVMVGYGVILGIRAMSGIDSGILRVIGLAVIAAIVAGVIFFAVSED